MTAKDVIAITAAHYSVTSQAILSSSRHVLTTSARKVAMFLCRDRLGMSYAQIGRIFGRDHSTVMHACRCVERNRDLARDADYVAARLPAVIEEVIFKSRRAA